MKTVLEEAHPGFCASHVTATVLMFVGMKNLLRNSSQACWRHECDNKSYLKCAKAVTTAIRKRIPPSEIGNLSGRDAASFSYVECSAG